MPQNRNSIRRSLQWLAFTVWMFLLLLVGITLELPPLVAFAACELIVCTVTVYLMSDIPPQYQ